MVELFYLAQRWDPIGTTTQGRPGSNGNEEMLHIPQKLHDWNLAIKWFINISRTLVGTFPHCRDTVGVILQLQPSGLIDR